MPDISLAQSPHIPTVGETLGAQAGETLNAIRDGRRAIAELNATIQQTRHQFWTIYPDGAGLKEAEAAYGRALLEKDLYYLQQLVAKQIAAPLVSGDDFDRSIANMEQVLGQVDGGIHAMALPEFHRWAAAFRTKGSAGISTTSEEFRAYAQKRNLAELFVGPKSPLRSSDPKEFLLGVLVRGTNGRLSWAEATAQFETFARIVGEESLLGAARGVSEMLRSDRGWRQRDPYYVVRAGHPDSPAHLRNQLVPPEPYIDTRIRPRTPEGQAIAFLYLGVQPGRWTWLEGWQEAEKDYKQLAAQHGEQHVQRAASLVARAPKDFVGGDMSAPRREIKDPQIFGTSETHPRVVFKHLLSLSVDELGRCEKAFAELMASRELVVPKDITIVQRIVRGREKPMLHSLAAANDGGLYGLAVSEKTRFSSYAADTVYRMSTDGRDFRLVHRFEEAEWKFSGVIRDGFTMRIAEGPDGRIYGAFPQDAFVKIDRTRTAPLKYQFGAIYSLGGDGRDFRVLYAPKNTEGRDPTVRLVDKHGTIFGVLPFQKRNAMGTTMQVVGRIFRLNPDGSGFQILHEFEGNPGLVDGDDGHIYGSGARKIFRLHKQTGEYTVLHEYGPPPAGGGLVVEITPGRDGVLFGGTTARLGKQQGHVFRMNRDGSGYTVLHLRWGKELVEGPGGMLYYLAPDEASNTQRVYRVAADGGSYPTTIDPHAPLAEQGVQRWDGMKDLVVRGNSLFLLYDCEFKPAPGQGYGSGVAVVRIGLDSLPPPIRYQEGSPRPDAQYQRASAEIARNEEQRQESLDARMAGRRAPPASATPAPTAPAATPRPAATPPPPSRRGEVAQPTQETGAGRPASAATADNQANPPSAQPSDQAQQEQPQPAQEANKAVDAARAAAEKINETARSLRNIFRR